MKILLIDDDKQYLDNLITCLEQNGHELTVCHSAEEALQTYFSVEPEAVIIDSSLPDMNGFECTEKIRNITSKEEWVPIIFLNSEGEDEDIARGLDVGGDAFIVKPASNQVIMAHLNAMKRILEMRNYMSFKAAQLTEVNEVLNKLSLTDGLTEIANRRYFDTKLKQEWFRSKRESKELSMLLIDIDCFKLFNDTYGHHDGDECLKQVANALKDSLHRSADFVSRYGGEEFAIILPNTPETGAMKVANRIKQVVEDLAIEHKTSTVADHITVSIGVSTIIPTKQLDRVDIIHAADKGLYKSKMQGRNQATQNNIEEY